MSEKVVFSQENLSVKKFPITGQLTLTKEDLKALVPLYSNEEMGLKAKAVVKFFCPWNQWRWYASEFDGEDLFFGWVEGHYGELGYFSLKELASVTAGRALCIERDIHFQPTTLEDLQNAWQSKGGM